MPKLGPLEIADKSADWRLCFATVPRAVGFTIVWPEGVIFGSIMTYHVQILLLVLAGWVNRQQQDVIVPVGTRRLTDLASRGEQCVLS